MDASSGGWTPHIHSNAYVLPYWDQQRTSWGDLGQDYVWYNAAQSLFPLISRRDVLLDGRGGSLFSLAPFSPGSAQLCVSWSAHEVPELVRPQEGETADVTAQREESRSGPDEVTRRYSK